MNMIEKLLCGSVGSVSNVTVKCRYWDKDVSVEMVSPYPRETNSVHMMYMVPRRYTENDLWQKTAWDLVRQIFERKEWQKQHRVECDARMVESRRRCEIISREIETLRSQLSELRRERRAGTFAAMAYQGKVTNIKRAIGLLEGYASNEKSERWLYDAMSGIRAGEMATPFRNHDLLMRNVRLYSRLKTSFVGDDPGWRMRLETSFPIDWLESDNIVDGGDPHLHKILERMTELKDPMANVLKAAVGLDGSDAEWRVRISVVS